MIISKKKGMQAVAIGIIYLIAFVSYGHQQTEVTPKSDEGDGSAYGLSAPGLGPELFAYDLVGNNDAQLALGISPNGKELYFTQARVQEQSISFELRRSVFVDNQWTPVEPVSFGSEYGDMEAFFNTSGQRLYFFSSRPENDALKPVQTMNLWYVEKKTNAWGAPQMLGKPGSLAKYGWSAALLDDRTLYFTARPHEHPGLADIYEVSITDGSFGEPMSIGAAINSVEYTENEPAIAPNGDYLVFYSAGRPDNLSSEMLGDLYVSFRGNDGKWLDAVHIEAPINSAAEENWPRISPDGKFLFFSSNRREGTGFPDLYWVSTKALQKYGPRRIQ
jgi:hypothetical protein